jgi:hypothetical protein
MYQKMALFWDSFACRLRSAIVNAPKIGYTGEAAAAGNPCS